MLRPEMKRLAAKACGVVTKDVMKSPAAPVIVVNIIVGKRPILSARKPNNIVPKTEPRYRKDCPIAPLTASSQTHLS